MSFFRATHTRRKQTYHSHRHRENCHYKFTKRSLFITSLDQKIVYLNTIIKDLKNILGAYSLAKVGAKNTLQERISALRNRISESIATCNIPHLISFESLHGWDPATWEEHLDLNKKLFGDLADSVEILISVRSTKSYLDSVYMQMIHQGLTNLKPETFFLKSDAYEIAKKYLGTRSQGAEIFCIDKLVYSSSLTRIARALMPATVLQWKRFSA